MRKNELSSKMLELNDDQKNELLTLSFQLFEHQQTVESKAFFQFIKILIDIKEQT